jgi:hypothetical protein
MTSRTNLKLGFWRLWCAATVAWVAIWTWHFSISCLIAVTFWNWWDDRWCGPLLTNTFEHFGFFLFQAVAIGVGAPILAALLGFVGYWIAMGFLSAKEE